MAHDDRTEKATPKHRRQARKEGQIARSADLGGSVVVAAGIFSLGLLGPRIAAAIEESFGSIFGAIAQPAKAAGPAALKTPLHTALSTLEIGVGPVAAVCLAGGLLAGAAQIGFRPVPQPLKLDFKRINPLSGAKRLVGPNAIFETVKAIAKIAVVGLVAGLTLIPGISGLAAELGIAPGALGPIMSGKALAIAQRATFAYLFIAVLDYAWQRRKHEQGLRMTKQQVKDEMRQHGLPAEVKAAQRRRRMQAARNRMMAAVPDADVVVTNPTHYAVALRYDGARTAPEVVAKGQDLIALQIRKIAAEHDVAVVPDPPLARALHASTEIGHVIPEELYAAVARVLAFVYRAARRRRYAL
ncbi:MAG TPA: EscU/YscU/HrcU family type III secretion system export apparatus switch protein [Solirubrobacteraceae bacterium]|nr:EscU/YscU/HrcU family type III secretion system export apparatus switch protein [Solirubrobacteraceae bacterium]